MALAGAPGSSTHPTQPMKYHVFLSFRGEDTRKTFTDHLYAALLRKGIITFRDNEELEQGGDISKELPKAIEQSLLFIVVLSEDYASSSWCLNELQQMMESKHDSGQTVFPVFYDVDPSIIRKQEGKVAEALEKHKSRFSDEEVHKWREALTKVAGLKGWDNKEKYEAELVEEIAESIWNKLCGELPSNFKHLLDVQSKVARIISLLKIGVHEKCFLGIWGMGGIGKTTLARVVYDSIQSKFDASCFLANVREDSEKFGLVYLQKKLLSNLKLGKPKKIDSFHGVKIISEFLCHKKVLIILDDVSHRSQLDNLAGSEEWFGAGSKIIITTRNKQLLTQYKRFEEYKVDMLDQDECLKLLCHKAFKKYEPEQGHVDLPEKVAEYASGVPFALEVLGSFLCRRDQFEWEDTLKRLRQNLHKDILSQLRISYDGLEDEEYKTIFLDIACFFNSQAKYKVTNMLKICGLHEIIGMKVLIENSFLSFSRSNSDSTQNAKEHQDVHDRIQRNIFLPTFLSDLLLQEASKEYVYMHYLLQEMGRNIVFQQCPINAGKRSRLWSLEDINLVLKENKGTEHIESIVLETRQHFEADWDANCFSKMINLRLLDLSKVHLLHDLSSLPSSLKFLRWDYYALEYIPSIDQLYSLESLQLCYSKVRILWNGTPVLNNLRIINLSYSDDLKETPDFSKTPNLEELLLNYCENLARVDDSVGQLKKLVKLSLECCRNLETLPDYLEMDKLEEFILMGCLRLERLPEFGRNMTMLYLFNVSGTGISEIPLSIIHLVNLKILDYSRCSRLVTIPALPTSLIVCTSIYSLKPPTALPHLYASRVLKRPSGLQGPIHLFYDFQLWTGIPKWFEWGEYCWGKDTMSEFVTITADIPWNVADSIGDQSWGIAVCLFLKSSSQAWQGFYIDWKFQDYCHPSKTKMHGTPYTPNGGVYLGFYPFGNEECLQHSSTQLHLTLYFPTIKVINNLEIKGCGWRLVCKKDFDELWEGEAPSSRHGFLNKRSREESSTTIIEGNCRKTRRNY